MLALYCQMKYRERRDRENNISQIMRYYIQLEAITEIDNINNSPKCRVCLQGASVYIYKETNREDIIEALEIFGNINLNSEDQYPKHLCITCWKFIQEAILFRKIAIKSNKILNKTNDSNNEGSNNQENDELITPDNHNDEDCNQESNDDRAEDTLPSNSIENDYFGQEFDDISNNKPKRKMIKCTICNRIMESRYYYNKHVQLHDPSVVKETFICEKCGKEFKSRQGIIDHSITHTSNFPFKCKHCPYRGRTKDALNTHTRMHIGVQKFLCTYCPKRFLHSSNLKVHMLKHKTPKFPCSDCDRKFYVEIELKKHVEVNHLGIKPYVCDFCGKSFGYRHNLTSHTRTVHKRAPLPAGRLPAYLLEQSNTQDE